MFGMVLPAVRVHIMRIKICAVDEPSINRIGVASSIVLKGRFPEIGSKSTVGDPSCCLFELNNVGITC